MATDSVCLRLFAKSLERGIEETSANTKLTLNLALSYGSRNEIVRAVQKISRLCAQGDMAPEEITDRTISAHLDTCCLPDPDLLIRTGGEARLSNFLLWQLSYAEIFFTDTMWPDFRKDDFFAGSFCVPVSGETVWPHR